jgi:hypothetical protein
LRELLEAEDLDQAIRSALPRIDEFFLGILRANIRSAMERKDQQSQARLENVDQRIRAVIRESLPPGLQVAQDLLDIEDPEEARAFLEESADAIDDELLNALLTTAQRLEGAGNSQAADRIKDLHRTALRLSMKSKLKKSSEPDKELDD